MPSLPILSCAKAAGAAAIPSERTKAEISSEAREMFGMVGYPYQSLSGDQSPSPLRCLIQVCYGRPLVGGE
jgi:hypothetical protein